MRLPIFQAAALAASCALLSAAPAHAAVNLLSDGDFESPATPKAGFTVFNGGDLIGGAWGVVGPNRGGAVQTLSNTYTEPNIAFNAESGDASMDLSGPGNVGPSAGIFQIVDTQVGHRYQLSFWVGNADGSHNGNYTLPSTVNVFINSGRSFTIEQSFTNADTTPLHTNWRLFQTSFVATGAQTDISFINGTSIRDAETGLDNVSLAAVPEPATWTMMIAGFGLAGAGLRRRQSRSIRAA